MPIILFLICPLLSLVSTLLLNIKKRKKIFYAYVIMFSLYFGWSFVAKLTDFDSFRIVEIFNSWFSYFHSYGEFIKEFLSFDNYFARDLYEGTVIFLVRSFTNNYHFFFLVCALVFTIFKLCSFDFFLKDYEYNISHTIIAVIFFISIPLFEINGVRFFTAAWVAIFATLKIFIDDDKRYWIVIFLTPLIHIAFILFAIILLFSYLMSTHINEKVLIILFIISVVIGLAFDTVPALGSFSQNLGIIGGMMDSYIDQTYKDNLDSLVRQSNYIRIFKPLKYLFYNVLAYVLYRNCKCPSSKYFTLLLLCCLTFTNCVSFMPDMERYFVTLIPLILFVLNKEINNVRRLQLFVYMLPLVEMFHIYQTYFTQYPQVLPDGFLLNVFMTL